MANIAYKAIQPTGDYIDLATEMGITFTVDTKYQIQIQNSAIICVSANKPTKGGFYIPNDTPFGYTHIGDTLWLKANQEVVVNIAEG